MAKFAVNLVYTEDRDLLQRVRPAHREYLKGLSERGILLAAGPFSDDKGALLIYEVADANELQQVLDADPYAPAGVVTKITKQEWHAALGSWMS